MLKNARTRFNRTVAVVLTTMFLVTATATAANAWSVLDVRYSDVGMGKCVKLEYRDYNWYTELFHGKKDGWHRVSYVPYRFCQ